jgi:GDPmannose 4,6-dehydratase
MKKALITGIRGQDGAYLAKLLLEKDYEVYGSDRGGGGSNPWRLTELGIDIKIMHMDLLDHSNIMRVIEKIKPDEVYNLAAQSFVSASFEQPLITADINAMGVIRILEALRAIKPDTKLYQASSSEMYGKARMIPENENTFFHPRSPYAVSKLFGHWITVNYRESFNMFLCSGILFNHESPLRGPEFITRKISHGVAMIKHGLQEKLVVGNLDVRRDWGYAPEYVEAMWLMLQQPTADDYVIATGENHSIREFIEAAFLCTGREIIWEGTGVNEKGRDKENGKILVEISREFFRPAEVDALKGDYSKAKEKLGWEPQTKFKELVPIMVEADLKRLSTYSAPTRPSATPP